MSAAKGSLLIGLDCGTQSTKCVVYNEKLKRIVGRGAAHHTIDQQRPGLAEQDPAMWITACKAALKEAIQDCDASEIKAIGVSGQQHGLVALDADFQVIRPAKLWCDVESAAEAQELSKMYGFTIVPSFTITKILWMKNHEPENYSRLAQVLLPHDYINWYLTGRCVMEASDASGTGVYNTGKRVWDVERMNAVDPKLQNFFPDLISPNDIVGTIRPDLATELGLSEGVVVSPGGGDNAMSALGSFAVQEGTYVLSLGTSGTLFGPSNTPVLDPTGGICPFADATGKWLPLLCTLNCTGVVEEVKNSFGMTHSELTQLAMAEPAGSDGVTFLPYLNGERTPNWPHSTGTILGLRPGMMRPGLLYRAAMEGATFSLLAGLERLRGYGLKASRIVLVGGGANNELWRRILADSFQLSLSLNTEVESASFGAALQAGAVASGVPVEAYVLEHKPSADAEEITPRVEEEQAYRNAYKRHVNYGNSIFGGSTADV